MTLGLHLGILMQHPPFSWIAVEATRVTIDSWNAVKERGFYSEKNKRAEPHDTLLFLLCEGTQPLQALQARAG